MKQARPRQWRLAQVGFGQLAKTAESYRAPESQPPRMRIDRPHLRYALCRPSGRRPEGAFPSWLCEPRSIRSSWRAAAPSDGRRTEQSVTGVCSKILRTSPAPRLLTADTVRQLQANGSRLIGGCPVHRGNKRKDLLRIIEIGAFVGDIVNKQEDRHSILAH